MKNFKSFRVSLFYFWTFSVCFAVFVLCPAVSAEILTGNLIGTFDGEIAYENPVPIQNGIVTGKWSFDTGQNTFIVTGRFASSGLSGDFTGEYDWNEKQIAGSWKSADGNTRSSFNLPLIMQSPYIFSGTISGTTSSADGQVPFDIQPQIEVQLQKQWFSQESTMKGTWTGIADGIWSVTVDTFLGEQTLSGTFSEPVSGNWNGEWNVGINNAGELAGTFDGVFSGKASVSISTPIGDLNVEVPVNGIHKGGILLNNKGEIEFTGVWHELMETHDTSGTVLPEDINKGYGGPIDLLLSMTETDFLVDGPVKGGGQYTGTQAFAGADVEVSYSFSGNFQGSLDYP